MGSIRKRSDNGFLFFDFRYEGQRCREQTALPDSPANRKNLGKILQKIEADISSGTFEYQQYFPSSKNVAKFKSVSEEGQGAANAPTTQQELKSDLPLFRDFAETWFSEKEVEWRRTHRISTRADIDRLLIPQFGDKAVDQVTKADILTFRATLAKANARGKTTPLSPRRINKIMGPLRQILCEAADRFDFRTPFHNIKSLKFRKVDIMPFTLEQVKLILTTVRSDFRNYYTVRFFTGMRTGEVDGLKWKFVDFERRLILIRETVVNGEVEYTKNDGSDARRLK